MMRVLTVSDDEADLFEAIKSGAEGYLLKNVHEEEFTDLLTRLRNGEPTLSPPMARKLLKEFARLKGEDSSGLTRREQEVLTLVARGGTKLFDRKRPSIVVRGGADLHLFSAPLPSQA